MSEQQFQKLMGQYRHIAPRDEFRTWSRRTILATPHRKPTLASFIRQEFVENLKFSFALTLTSVLLLVVFGGVSYWQTLLPNAGSRDLFSEAEQINQTLDIELREADYFYDSGDDIAAILEEIRAPEGQTPAATPHEAIF
ncbi:hypothetical protein HY478_01215 [Candidatus Uhrbacteria bacterium]|nr:hypothetical protein [Candidatus Uhrbacteria bacterium]